MEKCYMHWNLQSPLQRIVGLWFSMSALYCTLYSAHPLPKMSIVIFIHHHTFERPSNIEVSIRISMMNLFMKRVVNTCSSADICSSLFLGYLLIFFCQHIFTVIKFHDWRFRSYTYHIRYHFSLFLFSLIVLVFTHCSLVSCSSFFLHSFQVIYNTTFIEVLSTKNIGRINVHFPLV